MTKFSFLFLSSLFLVSCSTTIHKSQHAGGLDLNVQSKLGADVEVDMNRQVQGVAHHTKLFWVIPIKESNRFVDGVTYNGGDSGFTLFTGGMIEETKSAAAYDAVVPNKIQVLVAPQYFVQVKSYFFGMWKEVKATVTGYAGKIKSFKNTSNDIVIKGN
jgi:hypothetical protein